jgi:uncharacterized protein YxjI
MLGMRYLIRERGIAARDGFCVADESGSDILRVDGEGQQTFALRDPDGAVVTTIRRHLMAMRENTEIERAGAVVATVRKPLVSRLHHRARHSYGVKVAPGEDDHLLLTVALCLDRIHRDEAARRLG